jgi:hypothetical protein
MGFSFFGDSIFERLIALSFFHFFAKMICAVYFLTSSKIELYTFWLKKYDSKNITYFKVKNCFCFFVKC